MRVYLARVTTAGGRAHETRVTLTAERAQSDAEAVRWTAETASDEFPTPPAASFRARCIPDVGAEEPWMIPGIPGTTFGGERWLWPLDLETGGTFDGVVELRLGTEGPALVTHRSYSVEEPEQMTVPAGTFEAWRVSYVDDSVLDGASSRSDGTVWVARGVGLVRSHTMDDGNETVWELIEVQDE